MNKLLIAACLVLAACASPTLAPIQQGAEGAGGAQGSQGLSSNAMQTGVLSQADLDAQALAAQAAQTGDLQSVYFDYGTSEIRPEYSKVIQQQIDFMKSHAKALVTLEGNTDERGSNEFNLALADTRANAVKKLMMVSGIEDARIRTTSFGEEKPRLTCHEERCWKENRRVDFVYKPVN